MIPLSRINPFVRAAMIQNTVMEGNCARIPYDNRIFFVLDGNADLVLNGKIIPISENTLIFLGLQDEYFFKGKVRAVVVNFDMTMDCYDRKDAICPVPAEIYRKEAVFDTTAAEGFECPIVITVDANLRNEAEKLVQTYVSGGTFCDTLCSAIMKKILADILISLQGHKDKQTLLVDKILLYIKDNAAVIDSNEYLGKVFAYHPVYLAELFKAHTGRTLHSAILEEKLRVASRWLVYTNTPVERIACEVGFSSRNHFCTAFKKKFGCTPTAFRNKSKISFI